MCESGHARALPHWCVCVCVYIYIYIHTHTPLQGLTALMYASEYGQTEVVQQLIQARADVNAKDNEVRGCTHTQTHTSMRVHAVVSPLCA